VIVFFKLQCVATNLLNIFLISGPLHKISGQETENTFMIMLSNHGGLCMTNLHMNEHLKIMFCNCTLLSCTNFP